MKNVLYLVVIGLLCLFTSCTSPTAPAGDPSNAQAEQNKINNREIYKAIESGNIAQIDHLIAADAVDHSGPNNTEIKGADSIKSFLATMHNSFTDLKFDIISDAADGDYVFTLTRMTATTNANPGMGMPPNTKMDMSSVDVVKFKDGKVTDHWAYMDPKDMMSMMPQTGNMMAPQ